VKSPNRVQFKKVKTPEAKQLNEAHFEFSFDRDYQN